MKHLLTALLLSLVTPLQAANEQLADVIERGELVFKAAICAMCHTDKENNGEPLAGGYKMKTDFGTYYTSNITPDKETGIGNWSDEDFIRALQQGISPEGKHYFPSFPYTAYTKMYRDDVLALKAYLFSLNPVKKVNHKHDLPFYMTIVPSARIWKSKNFKAGEFQHQPDKTAEWNRGAYLVEAMGHCSACHTPRKGLGVLDNSKAFAGVQKLTGVGTVPNITPDRKTGIGRWSIDDLVYYFETGTDPEGDSSDGKMASIIDNSLSLLPAGDRRAIAIYLLSLKPVENEIKKEKKKREKEEFE